jgi:hypothetical protein
VRSDPSSELRAPTGGRHTKPVFAFGNLYEAVPALPLEFGAHYHYLITVEGADASHVVGEFIDPRGPAWDRN